MSTDKQALIAAISAGVMRYQDANQAFDELVGQLYELNPAERHCLSVLWQGPQTASAIAREIRLKPASVTALVDRLERKGFVRRQADAEDRRRVWIEPTERTQTLAQDVYAPIAAAGAALLDSYTADELAIILRFTTESTALQVDMTERLAQQMAPDAPSA